MSEDEQKILECYLIVESNGIPFEKLPERLQRKFEQLEELLDQYENCESEEEEKVLGRKIMSYDEGICRDLEPIVEKMQQDDIQQMPPMNQLPKAEDGMNIPSNSEPTWRFWM